MAAPNSEPVFSKAADIQWITAVVAANTTIDITSGTSYLVFTADATNGGYVRELRVKANPSQNTAATTLRVWINNGSATGAKANSTIWDELGIPATTASNTAPTPAFVMPLNLALPAGYKLYVTLGTATGGSSEFCVTALGGKY